MLGKTSLVVETNVRGGGRLEVVLFRRTGFVALKIDISKFQLACSNSALRRMRLLQSHSSTLGPWKDSMCVNQALFFTIHSRDANPFK